MKAWQTAALLVLASVLLVVLLAPGETDASPGRRSSSSSSRGSSSGGWFGSKKKESNGGGWFSSNKNKGNTGYNNNGNYGNNNNNYKKKGSKMKTLKKVAVIGAVAYGGYQLGKLSGRFSGFGHSHGHGYGFNDWNRWREIDGFMCRNTDDCNWIDQRLYCQDYELDFTPSALWFGGDVARIVGECACPHGMTWDNREMECETDMFAGIGMVLTVLLSIAFILCCCACAAFAICRKFF